MIDELGLPPVCRQIPDVQPSDGHEIARVRAAAIKNIERMLVAGTHYASTQLSLPAQVGMDAVAELIDGRRVYAGAIPPGGTMAEHMLVDPSMTVPVPDDVDDASAAALPNAGVSAWLSLEHTGQLRSGQSVLVLGATGVTGALAVQLAKHKFAAGHVVAVGRNRNRLEALTEAGADRTIGIMDDPGRLRSAIAKAHTDHPFDLVLDHLWGEPAEQALRALSGDDLAAAYHRTRFVQIGEMAGHSITLAASTLRSAGIELLGQGGGSISPEVFGRVTTEIIPELFDMLARGTLTIDTATHPIEDVRSVWNQTMPSGTRAVLVP